ncbi:hypothetical protein DY000_02058777 [Brassica cretica]|uniref:Uncharacterized protein n=1 Tax=Brassica cretica TaxID=69181 RepID=A0ABQ7B240_BRACR|nr:hypothetical protein DY000_02058777 [Brassica cretica]
MFAESSKGKDKGSRVMRWRGEQMGSGVGGTVASLRFGGGTTAILPVKGRRPTKRFLNFERLLKEEGNQVGGKDQEGMLFPGLLAIDSVVTDFDPNTLDVVKNVILLLEDET